MSEDPDDVGAGKQPGPFVAFAGMPVLSREAFMLHSFAVLDSVKAGQPGFVRDD